MSISPFSLLLKSIVSLAILPGLAMADPYGHREKDSEWEKVTVIQAENATGPNKILDKPIRNHGLVYGWPMGTLGFSELGVYNPDGNEPKPLTSETDPDAVLSTFLDPNFVAAIGFDPSDIDPSFINVPLQKVKTLYEARDVSGVPMVGRDSLPGMFDAKPFAPVIAAPTKPITLEDWLKARGRAVIKCAADGTSTVDIKMKHLVPNRLYTVWSANVNAKIGPFNQPVGGAPSAFTSDERGNGRFKRRLSYCPLMPVEDVQTQMLWMMVLLHTDHMAYGGVFAPNRDSLFGGTVAHVQLHIPLTGERVN